MPCVPSQTRRQCIRSRREEHGSLPEFSREELQEANKQFSDALTIVGCPQ